MQTQQMLVDEIAEPAPEREPRERGRSSDSLTGYLAEIARTPMLSREEETAWARRLTQARCSPLTPPDTRNPGQTLHTRLRRPRIQRRGMRSRRRPGRMRSSRTGCRRP